MKMTVSSKLYMLFICMTLMQLKTTVSAIPSKPSSIEIYPPFSFQDSEVSNERTGASGLSLKLRSFVSLIDKASRMYGAIYLGFKAFKVAKNWIHSSRHTNSTIGYTNTSDGTHLVIDHSLVDASQSSSHFIDDGMPSKALSELKSDQEELWRIVHNIFESQNEKLKSLEQSVESLHSINNEDVSASLEERDSASPDVSPTDVFERLQRSTEVVEDIQESMKVLKTSLESAHYQIARLKDEQAASTDDNEQQLHLELQDEIGKLKESISSTKTDLEASIKSRDAALIARIKDFGDELKLLLKEKHKQKSPSKSKDRYL